MYDNDLCMNADNAMVATPTGGFDPNTRLMSGESMVMNDEDEDENEMRRMISKMESRAAEEMYVNMNTNDNDAETPGMGVISEENEMDLDVVEKQDTEDLYVGSNVTTEGSTFDTVTPM